MAKARTHGCVSDTRLARIHIPGMEVEDRWPALMSIDAPNRPVREAIRQKTEEAPTARRHAVARQLYGGHGQLDQIGIGQRPVRETRRFWPAIMIVPDWSDARGIGITLLRQHGVYPGRPRADRDARSA